MRLGAASCLAVLIIAMATDGRAQCPDGQDERTIFGRRQNPESSFSAPAGGSLRIGSEVDAVRYFRLELRREPGGTSDGLLIVKDNDLRVVDVFRFSDLAVGGSVWTRRGTGNQATLRFEVNPGAAAKVTVAHTIGMPAEAMGNTYYSLQTEGVERFHPIYPLPNETDQASPRAKRLADSVGFIQVGHGVGEETWCCSAVAVGTDLLLTNWHCGGTDSMPTADYWGQDVCSQTLIDMSWDGDAVSREYQCVRAEVDQQLDLALLRVRGIDGSQALVPVDLASGDTTTGVVDLIHHPACKSKQETAACRILAMGPNASAQSTEFTHDCDSEQGSSGGGLFKQSADKLVLIGLHHAGFRREVGTCKALDRVNRGVRLNAVRDFLATARAKLDQP